MSGQTHMSCAEFARYLDAFGAGMSRQAVSKSHVIPKVAVGGKPMVPVAEGLRALEQAGRISLETLPADVTEPPAKTMGRPRVDSESAGGGYYDEKARTERVLREIKELELAQKKGELVRVDDVTDAMADAGRRIGEQLEQLAGLAGDLVAAATEGGEPAVRQFLRARVRLLRATMVDALTSAMGASDDAD
jgi:hypothetical protein